MLAHLLPGDKNRSYRDLRHRRGIVASTPLTARTRTDALASMSDEHGLDVLVIGGGVTGAGIALDAASRGLRTGIVEAQDWASGTSSRSSKLVHGGLRYLEMLDFSLVHEALTERDLLLTTVAPHLVHRVPFLYPIRRRVWERAYIGTGVVLYDILASLSKRRRALPYHRHVSKTRMLEEFPALREDAAVGAVQYWDAQVDDARLVFTLVRTAAEHGALAASRTQVTALLKSAGDVVTGARVRDLETGATHDIQARTVINATGVWTEETEGLSGAEGGLQVLASKGIHLVIPKERIQGTKGLILHTEKSVLFVIPWPDYWIIGTTDTPYTQDPRNPVATKVDIDYLLDHVNAVLDRPLTHEDIAGVYAGLRPLLQPVAKADGSSTKVSREHTVASPAPGHVAIAGGKLTTYRVMAKDAVDFALGAAAATNPSITDRVPLSGADRLPSIRRTARGYARTYGWTKHMVDHLLRRYGSNLTEIVELVEAQPDLAAPLTNAPSYLRAEIAYAARAEMVLHLEDVLLHRTRLDYEVADGGVGAIDEILDLISPILGWDEQRRARERDAFLARRESEAAAAATSSDAEGSAARGTAGDPSPMVPLDG
ncbi:FAD-dependent oxidoreductase [Pseudactinotalea sp. HY160]|nr:FAD-dependent oxidoreductase [Pseudactinotalea sp. HY160]